MKISALDLRKQIAPMRHDLDAAIKEVIDDAGFILGAQVERFERHAAQYCGAKHAVGVSNGTDAISLALLALGIKPGDGVICPAFTYYATAGAVASIGARPVFADIDQETYNLSLESVEKILKAKSKFKIKAIIPVHLYGLCAQMTAILKLAAKFKIKVIEDAAQAFGAEYKGKKAGTLGNCGAVSFYPGKNLGAFGDAGMVLTNSDSVSESLRILRNQGNRDRYYHQLLGRNNRMDGIQAAVLDIKLNYLDTWNKARQETAGYYNRNLSGLGIQLPVVPVYSTHIYHQYVIRAKQPNKLLLEYMQKKGIDARIFYPLPLHLQKCFKYLGYKTGDFPVAEKAARQALALPVHPDLTNEEKDYIIQSVKEFMHG
jgi:dTDP-4-amino-4,6-dideoxygalactose transaminase